MKLTKLEVEGFRSFRKLSWSPGDLNVVIGPNASGKSNLLHLCNIVAEATRGSLSEHVAASGGFGSISWNGQSDLVRMQFDVASNIDIFTVRETQTEQYRLSYGMTLRRIGHSSSYTISEEFLRGDLEDPRNIEHSVVLLVRDQDTASVRLSGASAAVGFEEHRGREETVLSYIAGPEFSRTWLRHTKDFFAAWYLSDGLRTDSDAQVRQPYVTRFEHRAGADGQNFPSVLQTLIAENRDFERTVDDCMSAAFDDFGKLIFAPAGSGRSEMRIRWKSSRYDPPAADLSDGTLRFLFLITVLANPNPPPLIAIDEPETGLHPSMLGIVAGLCADASLRTQVIVATHSDQLLSAISEYNPTVSVTKWESGETTLRIVDEGELAYWLKDYSLGELFRSGQLEWMG